MARSRLPTGTTPWDTIVGFRVGAAAGGLVGVVVAIVIGAGLAWLLAAGAIIGSLAGYAVERSKRRR